MSSSDRHVTARSINDLLAVVPYLLGFHPADSLLVLAQHGTRLVFAVRVDLPLSDPAISDPISDPAVADAAVTDAAIADAVSFDSDFYLTTEADAALDADERWSAMAEAIADLVCQRDVTAVVLIGYGPAEHVDPGISAVTAAFTARVIPIVEALRVSGGRYFSYTCDKPHCCPPGGTVFDPARSSIPAEAIYAGQVALPGRAAVVAQVAAQGGPGRDAILAATARAERRLIRLVGQRNADPTAQELARIRRRLSQAGLAAIDEALDRYRTAGTLTDDEAAWLSVLLRFTEIRDLAWDRIDPAQPEHLALWCDLTRRAAGDFVAAPASLAAYTAWQRGNGILAGAAVQRALTADPRYRLANILADILSAGMPPTALNRTIQPDGPTRPDETTQPPQPASPDNPPGHTSPAATESTAEEGQT